MMKKLAFVGGGLVVIAVGAVILLVSNIDSVIRTAVEEVGSRATQARVTLNEVEISAEGKGALRGFTVGNPSGFDTESAFRLGEVSVALDVASVTSDTVHIHEVMVLRPDVTFEYKPGGNNLQVLQKNVESFAGSGGSDQAARSESDTGSGKKLIIDRIVLRDGTVTVSANQPFLEGRKLTAPLPTIELKDVGKAEGGASAAEVANRIMAQVTAAAGKAVGSLNIGELSSSVQGLVSGAVGSLAVPTAGVQDAVQKGVGSGGETLTKGAEDASGALKKLLGN